MFPFCSTSFSLSSHWHPGQVSGKSLHKVCCTASNNHVESNERLKSGGYRLRSPIPDWTRLTDEIWLQHSGIPSRIALCQYQYITEIIPPNILPSPQISERFTAILKIKKRVSLCLTSGKYSCHFQSFAVANTKQHGLLCWEDPLTINKTQKAE